ncbi:MAG: isoleucine--tRNA ligase [Candidatus Xenobia bacterium]
MNVESSPAFAEVEASVKLPVVEERILGFWRDHDIFGKSLTGREGAPEFIFFEGPPTANGRPGVHHVQARAYKDLIPRYKTMRGYLVRRKGGWDCHGLPVELEVEKKLGINGKPNIEKYGVEPFNKQCRKSVMEYEGAWRQMTERIAFWVDVDHAYMTMTNDYIESVWWSLRQLWDKNLIYLGYKVVPYCPRCGTPLSSHEVGLGYEDITDPSIYVRFPLQDAARLGLQGKVSLLVWTTTPWTLPGNVAAAINPKLSYVAVQSGDETFVLGADVVEKVFAKHPHTVTQTFAASEIAGLEYEPPYRPMPTDKKAYYVVEGSFVTAEDGTGIVHIAPAFGADDMDMARQNGLPVLRTVDEEGNMLSTVSVAPGVFFRHANQNVIDDLKARGVLYHLENYVHSYPHCWRCDTPLMYYATNSWFINNSSRKAELQALNQKINWIPAHIKDGRYGDWLENLVDWALSRSRYWGTPLPIWLCEGCDHKEMIGSYQELSERWGQKLPTDFDPHRPYVDRITFKCPGCEGTMRRVVDVIDCWYDSGSMPFAQWHYPFENQDVFKKSFPADFICEGLDQTRGWFNSLHQLGTMLFDTNAYRNVICHGLVLDEEGNKMSKSRGNVVNPWDVLNTCGADALRWYLYTSSPPEFNRRFSVNLVGEAARGFLMTLWNTYSFFVMYARLDRPQLNNPLKPVPHAERPLIDRWVLARLHALIEDVTEKLDVYNLTAAARALNDFVDELSNWYVRLNRRRFWKSEGDADKRAAYQTLYTCLVTLARLAAPFTPFLAEELYQNLVRTPFPDAPESVHLTDWPAAQAELIDRQLLRDTEATMKAVNLGRAARSASGMKVRQPLPEALVRARSQEERQSLIRFSGQIADELNVKKVTLLEQDAKLVAYTLKPNLKLVGKKYGKLVPGLKVALEQADGRFVASETAAGRTVEIVVDGETLTLLPDEILVEACSPEGYSVEEEGGMLVALDTRVTEELKREGLARDVVRHIQSTRKSADLQVSDHIRTWLLADPSLQPAIESFRDYIMQETLTRGLHLGEPATGAFTADVDIDGASLRIGIQKV